MQDKELRPCNTGLDVYIPWCGQMEACKLQRLRHVINENSDALSQNPLEFKVHVLVFIHLHLYCDR